jgi:hypothetical protein
MTGTELIRWQNISAGPRQVKDLTTAMSKLRAEGQTHDELTGVIGSDEHRSTLMTMFGGHRPEVTALDEAIRAKHGYQITRENVRQIIADYEAAMPEARKSRPTEDCRRTPEEDAERRAASAARDAEYQAKRDAEQSVLSQVIAKAPHGAKALIFAEYHEDASDLMTDYHASRVTRTVAIGYRYSSREDFRALRAAAGQFPETAHMSGEECERRDNYSMGAGNYLSDHGSANSGTGWVVKSREFPCSYVHLTEDAIPEAPAAGGRGFYDQRGNWIPQGSSPAPVDGVTVRPSSIGRDGVVEIVFPGRPGDDVLAELKARGFRWARGNRCWYGTDTAYAESLRTPELATA